MDSNLRADAIDATTAQIRNPIQETDYQLKFGSRAPADGLKQMQEICGHELLDLWTIPAILKCLNADEPFQVDRHSLGTGL